MVWRCCFDVSMLELMKPFQKYMDLEEHHKSGAWILVILYWIYEGEI